jgi:AcrR family transcriptional regulator
MAALRQSAQAGLVSDQRTAYPPFMTSTRLTPEKWLAAGFDALQELGSTAIAAEPLARRLKTTKGSFYWHFKDVPAFQDALLANWQKTAMAEVEALPTDADGADQKLRRFGRDIAQDRKELALRIWAQQDARAAMALADVDKARHAYLVKLLGKLGLGNPDFACALQAALIGLPQLSPDDHSDQVAPFDTLVDTVLALAES